MHTRMIAVLCFLVCVACSFKLPAFLSPGPKVTNHPQPAMKVDTGPFESAGCTKDSSYWRCPEGSQLKTLGCDFIEASDLLGGLSPAYPMVLCETRSTHRPDDAEKQQYIYWNGCLVTTLVRLVVYKEGQFQLIKTRDDLKATFTPVDTPEKALSYALAATGLTPVYGFKVESGYRYFVSSLEDTHVAASEDGYHINLYDRQLCGCGPHPFFRIDVLIDKAGSLKMSERQSVFENPKEDDLCID
jgi:hypothetical protein